MTKFELTVLGTSSALPTSQRYPTAHVLNVHERFFLIDCGEGTQIQLKKYHLRFTRINHILISHLHGDHYFGLLGLISTFILLGRQADLHIYSHSLLPELLKPQLDFMNQGNDTIFNIVWHPLNFKRPQTIFEDEALEISSFPLKHRIPCCGFIFREKPAELNLNKDKIRQYNIPFSWLHLIKQGADYLNDDGTLIPNQMLTLPPLHCRTYVFCTDTLFMPENARLFEHADLLYHEATYDHLLEKRAEETSHSTARQAAELAHKASVDRLIIGHFSARYKDPEKLLLEAREVFPNTDLAIEGAVFSIDTSREE